MHSTHAGNTYEEIVPAGIVVDKSTSEHASDHSKSSEHGADDHRSNDCAIGRVTRNAHPAGCEKER